MKNMKIKLSLGVAASLLALSMQAVAGAEVKSNFAAYGSTQFVTIMNGLIDAQYPSVTKSDIVVDYFDGSRNSPCWTSWTIGFHGDPLVAGAGGNNSCGTTAAHPSITSVLVAPLKTATGLMYQSQEFKVDTNKFYTTLIIEQDTPPTFNPDFTVKTPGTIKIRSLL